MKTIVDDPEGFFESGGWNFLDPDSGSEVPFLITDYAVVTAVKLKDSNRQSI